MNEPCCAATTVNGRPCGARPLPGGDRCLFHDPAHQQALAESRSKGGATPRRRTRRYPLLLDYKHVAELLSELLIEALNDPAAFDSQRLRALTGLATVLLKAVGRPRNTYEIHKDRTEPPATEAHLLRIYPPEPPSLTCLRAADAQLEAQLATLPPPVPPSPSPHLSDPSDPSDPPDLPPPPPRSSDDRSLAEFDPRFRTPPEDIAVWHAASCAAPGFLVHEPDGSRPHPDPEPRWRQDGEQDAEQDAEQAAEQDRNRAGTGPPATEPFSPSPAVAAPSEPGAGPAAEDEPGSAAPDSVSPCLRVEETATTLSVPGVPILISYRRIPGPFE